MQHSHITILIELIFRYLIKCNIYPSHNQCYMYFLDDYLQDLRKSCTIILTQDIYKSKAYDKHLKLKYNKTPAAEDRWK